MYKFLVYLFRIDSKIDVLLLEELAVIIGGLSDNNIILRDIKQGLKQKI
jgi:hypothetical protein